MENNYKKEARRQYIHYFCFWFAGIGILAAACVILWAVRPGREEIPRTNMEAPKERVYDYADVLTQEEEEKLRRHIAEAEGRLGIDIVLMTIDYSVEGEDAMEKHNLRYRDWERNMQDIADDFWDQNRFGYNKSFEGDGILLLHNWYTGQTGEHISTSGSVERAFSSSDIDRVLDAVDAYYDFGPNTYTAAEPYKSYIAYVDKVEELLDRSSLPSVPWPVVFILPVFVAAVYAMSHLSQSKAQNTTAVNAYVAGGRPEFRDRTDAFIRKSVVTRKIQTDSGGSGGSGRSGGGGHHYSSGGASHGGGSRRH